MDSQGFVLLSVIANFNRIKELNSSLEQLKLVCQQSQILEWRLGVDGKDRIRKREGWDKWIVEMAKRDASAQHDGIEAASPAPPNPEGFVPVRHSSLPNSLSPHSPAMVMVPMNGSGYLPELLRSPTGENADFSGFQTSPPMNPLYSPPGNMEQQPVKAPGYIPSGAPGENDNLSDAQVDNLMVMVRPGLPNGHQKTEEPKANGVNAVSGPSVVPSHE
jgi:la-related protein 1